MAQSLKLGLSGLETELPTKSRINTGYANQLIKVTATAVSGKIHEDFTARRRVWTITWDVNTQETEEILNAYVDLQINNGTHLSFIKTDKDNVPETIIVSVEVPSFGTLLPNGEFFNFGASMVLTEVL